MKFKKIITVLCAAMLITSAFASCGNNQSDDFNTSGASVNVVDGTGNGDGTDGNQGGDSADGSNQTSGGQNGDEASQGEPVVTYDPASEYQSLPTVDTEIKRCPATVTTTYFTVDDQYIYYIDNQDEAIYKIPKDGSGDYVKLCDDKVSTVDITSDGKLAYTINMEEGMDSNSFTMDKDGSNVVDNKELILDFTGPTEFKGKDGKIYATLGMNEGLDEDGIYVREEGQSESEATLIKAGFIDSFCLIDDYIVCAIAGNEGINIYRCNLDGSDMVRVIDDYASKICSDGSKIFFINRSDNNMIYEMTLDAVKNAK